MKYTLLRGALKDKDIQKGHMLKDCNLVIDGRTYFHTMYRNSGFQFIIGGEYDRYASYVRNQLKTFVNSNVICYVIFNGGMKADVERRKEIHQSIIDKTDAVVPDSENNEYCEPIFAKDVIKEVLTELGIKYFVAEYDSRQAILDVARKLQCPVLTSSYEYCLYGVQCITPKSLSYDEARKSISCRLLGASDNKLIFPMRYDMVPIFITLLDEDGRYIERLPDIKTRRKERIVISVNIWSKRQTKETALKYIAKNLKDDAQRNEFLDSYNDHARLCRTSFKKTLVLECLGINKYANDNSTLFQKAVADGTVAIPYVNLRNNSTFSGSWLVVDKNEEDAMLPAMEIVKYVNATLIDPDKGKITFIGRKYGKSDVWDMEWSYAEPVPKEALWRKISGQFNLKPQQYGIVFKRFLEITLPGFKIEKLESLPENCWMIMITLVYYGVKRAVDMPLVCSILLSYVMVGPVTEKVGIIKRSNLLGLSTDDNDKTQGLSSKDCAVAAQKLVELFHATNIKRSFNRRILHTLAEFQHCLQHMNYLNNLCGETVPYIVYHKALNILFVYNAYVKMAENDKERPTMYFERVLGKSTVLDHFQELLRVYDDCFSSVKTIFFI